MYRSGIRACLLLVGLWAAVSNVSAQDEQNRPTAPGTTSFRANADVELRLEYQGTAEGMLSRGLHLFGATANCQVWYRITDVIAAPVGMGIQEGDRIWLRYTCDSNRRFKPKNPDTVSWAQRGSLPYVARAWLRRRDIRADKAHTWAIPNPHDWFAPVANSEQ